MSESQTPPVGAASSTEGSQQKPVVPIMERLVFGDLSPGDGGDSEPGSAEDKAFWLETIRAVQASSLPNSEEAAHG